MPDAEQVTEYFLRLNEEAFSDLRTEREERGFPPPQDNDVVISFSPFRAKLA